MADTEQPFIDHWPLFEEAHSKFPALADIEAARIKLARRFKPKPRPKATELHPAWQDHGRPPKTNAHPPPPTPTPPTRRGRSCSLQDPRRCGRGAAARREATRADLGAGRG